MQRLLPAHVTCSRHTAAAPVHLFATSAASSLASAPVHERCSNAAGPRVAAAPHHAAAWSRSSLPQRPTGKVAAAQEGMLGAGVQPGSCVCSQSGFAMPNADELAARRVSPRVAAGGGEDLTQAGAERLQEFCNTFPDLSEEVLAMLIDINPALVLQNPSEVRAPAVSAPHGPRATPPASPSAPWRVYGQRTHPSSLHALRHPAHFCTYLCHHLGTKLAPGCRRSPHHPRL